MSVRFEWHVAKADDNFRKHHVAFDEAATVFRDSLAVIFADETHSSTDRRELIIGHSVLGRLLIVSFAETPECAEQRLIVPLMGALNLARTHIPILRRSAARS